MESSFSCWEQISISRPTCGKTCPCTEAVCGFRNWEHQWSFQREPNTHVPCRQRSEARHHRLFLGVKTHETSDTEMRDCEVCPLGVRITVSSLRSASNSKTVVSRQLIGKFNKRDRHNTNALQGLSTQHTDSADPAIWNEARRNCVFEGKKPRCQDGQEGTQAACSQYAHACGFLEEADELGHALQTWSDATNQYWVKVGRMCKTPSSGKFATFRMKPALGGTFMPLDASFWKVEAMPN